MPTAPYLCLTFVLAAIASSACWAEEQSLEIAATAAQQYVQVWLGTTDAEEAWTLDDPDSGIELSGGHSSLPLGGGVGQRMWGRTAQYGFEGGGLLSWKNDNVDLAGSSRGGASELLVAIDNELFIMEAFVGGVVALEPARWLRFYAAAGPALAWGYLSGDDDEDVGDGSGLVATGPNTLVAVDFDDSGSDVSFALYGRAGIEIELAGGFTFGAGARYADHDFDFDERGRLKLDEVQWLLTLGARL